MRDERGFSLLELVIVILIVGLLMVVALDRMLRLRYEAEQVMVQSMLAGMRSALLIEFSGAAVRGQAEGLAEARGTNPIARLSEKPETYAGEFFGADPATFAPGSWYFDKQEGTLVYVVRFPEQFESGLAGPARARFRIEPDYDDLDKNNSFDRGKDQMRGLRLVPAEPYAWREAK